MPVERRVAAASDDPSTPVASMAVAAAVARSVRQVQRLKSQEHLSKFVIL
jgi:hypothetical protein